MKVAYIDELAFTKRHGGSATTTTELSSYLNKEGFETRVYSFSNGIKTAIPDKIKLFSHIRELMVLPYIGRKIIPDIEKKNEIIHFSSTTTSAFYKAKIPTIITARCSFSRQIKLFNKFLDFPYTLFFNRINYTIFKYLENKSFKNVNHIIVYKKDIKSFLINELNISPNKISVIPIGIDVELFKPPNDQNKENYILFVGRGTIAKGFDTLLEAASFIDAKVIAVAPHIMQRYKGVVKRTKNVEVIEKIDHRDIVKLYQKAKVFVMPSLSETGPRVTLEAMACGLPVVCTLEGGGDFVKDGVNGFIIPFRDPKSLAEKVNFILNKDNIMRSYGNESRNLAKKFSIQNRAEKIIKVYESLI